MAMRVGINGFGRIGRLVHRAAQERSDIEILAVNDLVPSDDLAYLLRYDSTHGRLKRSVTHDDKSIKVDGKTTRVFAERDPAKIPWQDAGVDYVLESTGLFTKGPDARKHVDGGKAKRVLISAPTKTPDEVRTFAYKINHEQYDPEKDYILSNASCTTNCLAPMAKIVNDEFGLVEGLMTTVHAVTATQVTQDGPSSKDKRGGRNAYDNIIPASTGAAKAVTLCIPELKGKLTGMAFRVPTVDVSVVDLTFRTEKSTSLSKINEAFRAASEGAMKGVLAYTEDDVVSTDFITDPHSCIYDAGAGIELNQNFFKIVGWYDNEYGYACRCIDMLAYMAQKDGNA